METRLRQLDPALDAVRLPAIVADEANSQKEPTHLTFLLNSSTNCDLAPRTVNCVTGRSGRNPVEIRMADRLVLYYNRQTSRRPGGVLSQERG
jgi:hypothetical protein